MLVQSEQNEYNNFLKRSVLDEPYTGIRNVVIRQKTDAFFHGIDFYHFFSLDIIRESCFKYLIKQKEGLSHAYVFSYKENSLGQFIFSMCK